MFSLFLFSIAALADTRPSEAIQKLQQSITNAVVVEPQPYSQTITIAGQSYNLRFVEGDEYCSYNSLEIRKAKKLLAKLPITCGLPLKSSGKSAETVKLGPKAQSEYIHLAIEGPGQTKKAVLLSLHDKKPEIVVTTEIDGTFKDYNRDGLADLLKEGGTGEPTGVDSSAYAPYLVYAQKKTAKGISFVLDEKLSEKFSKENNFEWHGSKYSEFILVDKNGKKK